MTREQRLQQYEAEVLRLMNAAYDGHIPQEDVQDEIDDLVHPLVDKRPSECNDDERSIIAAWFMRQGDDHMRKADSILPGIVANPGIVAVQ